MIAFVQGSARNTSPLPAKLSPNLQSKLPDQLRALRHGAGRSTRFGSQQRSKSGLLEMFVVRKRLGDAAFFHDVEGNAIGKGPGFVSPSTMQSDPCLKKFRRGINKCKSWIAVDFIHQKVRLGTIRKGRKIIYRFPEHVFCEEQFFLNRLAPAKGTFVESIPGHQQRDQITAVEKDHLPFSGTVKVMIVLLRSVRWGVRIGRQALRQRCKTAQSGPATVWRLRRCGGSRHRTDVQLQRAI